MTENPQKPERFRYTREKSDPRQIEKARVHMHKPRSPMGSSLEETRPAEPTGVVDLKKQTLIIQETKGKTEVRVDRKGRIIFPEGKCTFTIGRGNGTAEASAADFQIPGCPTTVSRVHLEVKSDGKGNFSVQDMGAGNGTFLGQDNIGTLRDRDGHVMKTAEVKKILLGDRIMMGVKDQDARARGFKQTDVNATFVLSKDRETGAVVLELDRTRSGSELKFVKRK